MTQLFTDFSEYATGTPPSDWSYRKRNAGSSATRAVVSIADGPDGVPTNIYRITSNENDRQLVSWDAVNAQPDSADADQVMLMRWSTRGATFEFRPAARVGNLADAVYYTSGFTTSGLVITLQNGNIAQTPFSIAVNQWAWFRFRIQGTALKAKAWLHGEVEPGGWMLEVSDATYAAGDVGIFFFEQGQTIELARTGVGTGGDVAPMAALPTVVTATTTPFSASWTPDAAGTYQITPVARKSDGSTLSGKSAQVTVS